MRLLGVEPRTSWSVAKRSIQLSYRRQIFNFFILFLMQIINLAIMCSAMLSQQKDLSSRSINLCVCACVCFSQCLLCVCVCEGGGFMLFYVCAWLVRAVFRDICLLLCFSCCCHMFRVLFRRSVFIRACSHFPQCFVHVFL